MTPNRKLWALAVGLLCAGAGPARGSPPATRVYIAPDDHTDYVWSADEETYRRVFVETLDYYLAQADATANLPPEHQARWNTDGSLWVRTYEKDKTPAEFERLVARMRDGHIGMPLNALVNTYGGTPTEAVLRGMYYAGSLERRFGVRFPIAIAMENQTLPLGLGALWAGAGARYSWKGICGCATKLDGKALREHEVYWWKGVDDSRLLMKWYSKPGGNGSLGSYAECLRLPQALDLAATAEWFRKAHPYQVIGLFGKGWDYLQTLSDELVTAARTKSTPLRRIIVSNQLDYFQDFEARYGRSLPTQSVSFGNEWDLYTASMAEVSARVRRAVEKLRAAEAMATLVALRRPDFLRGRDAERAQAWMGLGVYWEHNWTADGKHVTRAERAAWQRRVASEIENYVDRLHSDAAGALGGLIKGDPGRQRVFAFNPLGWARTDAADVTLWKSGPVHVVDLATGAEVPSQVTAVGDPPKKEPRRLRFQARDVPAVGYKVFEVRAGAGTGRFAPGPSARGNAIENGSVRVTVDGRGAITSLVDQKAGGRELARAVGGRWINDLGPGPGKVVVESAGPVSATLRATGATPVAHQSRITLFRDSPRIEIENEITQNFSDVQSWSFGLALDAPDVWHEEVGAILRARLHGDGGHYASRNARLDWLTLNHFAAMTGAGGAGVTLSSSDLSFMKLGHSSIDKSGTRLDTATPRIQVLAGGQVDGPTLGIPAQGGDARFLQRFALRTHARGFGNTDAMKFALEHQNPLVVAPVHGAGPYAGTSHSLLGVSSADVLVWAVKPAEEGIEHGVVVRLWNVAPEPRETEVSFAPGLKTARRTSHIETDIEALAVNKGRLLRRLGRSEMVTLRMLP